MMSSIILFVDLVAMPEGPHPIPFRTRSLSLPGPMVLRLKARESRSPPGLQKGCLQAQTLQTPIAPRQNAKKATDFDAGWSSPVARQAHNLKVTGSNPVPAPKSPNHHPITPRANRSGRFCVRRGDWHAATRGLPQQSRDPPSDLARRRPGAHRKASGSAAGRVLALEAEAGHRTAHPGGRIWTGT